MVAGGTSGGAYRRNGLPSDYDITPGHIQCRCMHIDRIQAAAMVDHDVVPHGIAVGGCHHLAVVGGDRSREKEDPGGQRYGADL